MTDFHYKLKKLPGEKRYMLQLKKHSAPQSVGNEIIIIILKL